MIGYDGLLSCRPPLLPFEDESQARDWGGKSEGRLVAIDSTHSGYIAVIKRFQQDPFGSTYTATLTVQLCWRVDIVCYEFGMTGVREAILTYRMLEGREFGTAELITPEQMQEILRRSEEPCWDAEFPQSPLSRVRRYISEVTADL